MIDAIEPYGTHFPYLAGALAETGSGDVLELGAGHYSTPMLHHVCKAAGRRLVTLETDKAWMEKFYRLYCDSSFHQMLLVDPEWKSGLIDGEGVRWSVVLLDCNPHQARGELLKRLRGHADIVVVHDAEDMKTYGYDWSGWEEVTIHQIYHPATAILRARHR